MATFKLKEVSGIEASLHAMRYPMDSKGDTNGMDTGLPVTVLEGVSPEAVVIGNKDMTLAKKLANTKVGSGHCCFLKGITVHLTVEAPHYWWNQAQRYHWFDIISSIGRSI